MTEYYLSDNVVIYDGKYYKNNNLVLEKNWHKQLNVLGWSKLDKSWILRLNNFKKEKGNSRWGVYNIEDNGDCFFSCIAEALNNNYYLNDNKRIVEVSDIRHNISKGINENNFNSIIEIYKIEQLCGEFRHKWNIDSIKTYKNLQEELTKLGHNYWADHVVIQLFQKVYNMNLIILNKSNNIKHTKIYSLFSDINPNKDTIILYYIEQSHFQLIGYFTNNHFKTIFKYEELPYEILKIYNIDCR